MFELLKVETGVRFYRNIDTNELYAETGGFWWKDVDGKLDYFLNVKAPEACRFLDK